MSSPCGSLSSGVPDAPWAASSMRRDATATSAGFDARAVRTSGLDLPASNASIASFDAALGSPSASSHSFPRTRGHCSAPISEKP